MTHREARLVLHHRAVLLGELHDARMPRPVVNVLEELLQRVVLALGLSLDLLAHARQSPVS